MGNLIPSARLGWQLTSNSKLKYTLVANKSHSTIIQVSLQSGAQARNYAVSVLVVDAITLTSSPFTGNLFLWRPGTTYTYLAYATGDSRVTSNGRVNYAWLYKVCRIFSFNSSNFYILYFHQNNFLHSEENGFK